MARTAYPLRNAREATLVSSNDTTYTINILWVGAGNTDSNSMTLGPTGVQISYENPNDKDKNSYIITSKCILSYMVTDAADKTFINSLSTGYEEKQVWITVREGSNMLWCGYILLDLKDEQDGSYPYEVSLEAIDGLAALKEVPFIRETNTTTGSVPEFPYNAQDTFNSGYRNLLGNAVSAGTTTKYLSYLIAKTGMVLSTDINGSTANFLVDYPIQTAVNYYNDGHPAPAADIDPLGYTKILMNFLYEVKEENISVPDCYTALEYICKNFGMRCVYWQHTFHFISLDEYNTDEDAAGTAAVPINIPTRLYEHTGVVATPHTQNYLGSNSLSIYNLSIENATAPGQGLQKLAGSIYTGIPPIKTAKGMFFGYNPGYANAFRGWPDIPTFNSTGAETTYLTFPTDANGAIRWATMTDAADADGIHFMAKLKFKNTNSSWMEIAHMFVMVAKPSSQSATVGADTKYLQRINSTNGANMRYHWVDWTSGTYPPTLQDGNTLRKLAISNDATAGTTYFGGPITVQPSASINAASSTQIYSTWNDPNCTSSYIIANNLASYNSFPVDAAFTGDWDFAPMSFTCWDSNASSPLAGFSSYGGGVNFFNSNAGVNGYQAGSTNYQGVTHTSSTTYQEPDYYQFDWGESSGLMYLKNGPPVAHTTKVEINVLNENTFVYDGGNYFWGEGPTIEVSSDGSTYLTAGTAEWTNPTYVWHVGTSQFNYTVGAYDETLVNMILLNIIYNQSIALTQLNGTTALSETNKFYSGTSILKYMNPIGKLKDADDKEYVFERGTFTLLSDEWESTLNEVIYEIPAGTINKGELQIADPGYITGL